MQRLLGSTGSFHGQGSDLLPFRPATSGFLRFAEKTLERFRETP